MKKYMLGLRACIVGTRVYTVFKQLFR